MIEAMVKKIEKMLIAGMVDVVLNNYCNYKAVPGATEQELQEFERDFSVTLPEDFKELYRYKNGSSYGFDLLFPSFNEDFMEPFYLLSLEEIRKIKSYFFNRNELLSESGFLTSQDISELDERIQPYRQNERWIPFAEVEGYDIYLMMDFDPSEKGAPGQIISYIHDPDFIYFVTDNIQDLLRNTIDNHENGNYRDFF